MRRLWMLLGVALLSAVLAVGAMACDDDDDDDNGEPPVATDPADQPAPTLEGEDPGNGEEPANGDTVMVIVTDGILTDAEGFTLYTFDQDLPGVSNCFDACLELWPALLATNGVEAGEGVPGTLGTTDRMEGTTQVTHDDLPLYYYSPDTLPGDRNGDGLNDVWHVVSVE